jgi:hypothetical protein
MYNLCLKSHIGQDSLLKVHLPDMQNTDIEVVIVYQTSLTRAVEAEPLSRFSILWMHSG